MRIIKDEQYVKGKYDKCSYQFKSVINNGDLNLARNSELNNKNILWNCNSDLIIHSANLLGGDSKDFPPLLKKQKELFYLAIPSQLVNKINTATFLSNLRGLKIDGGKLRLKENVVLDKLLYLGIDGSIFFKKENLPSLRTLSCKYDVEVVEELSKYELFDKLTLKSVNENIFRSISNIKEIYGLQINKGKLNNIDGIASIKSLQWLSLDNLPELSDLGELTKIDNLEHLQIGYCKNITKWDFLLELKHLKTLWIPVSSSKELPPQSIIDSLIEKGVNGIRKGF